MMKRRIMTVALAVLVAALTGCGSSDSAASYAPEAREDYKSAYAADNEIAEAGEYYDEYEEYDYNEFPAEESAKMTAGEADASMDEATVNEADAESVNSKGMGRMLIKNVYLSVESEDVEVMVKNVEKRVDSLGGYIESTNIENTKYSSSERKTATIVARVPVEKLDGFVDEVEGQSNVLSKNSNAEDVTLRYVDMQSKLESYEIEYDRINELLKQADDLDTIIALESRLTEIRYQIESYGAQLKQMKNQATYSTVTLNIEQVIEYTPVVVAEKTRLERMSEGFISNCKRVWNGLLDFLVGLVIALPVLLIWAVIIIVIVLIIRFIINKNSRYTKEERARMKAEKKAAKRNAKMRKTGNGQPLQQQGTASSDEEGNKSNE
ncbi:MAG: DUF4349 domain-containing protein [Lachnospiraceae bacterium]|nr:DUF4349 domain-containing protein [Lachnospiraceae bacterium]